MTRSQKGSIISTEPGYRFQPVSARARSASGYADDYYMDSGDERPSFVCSKPGFVCLAAVIFTISFISLAFFLETSMPWRNQPTPPQAGTNTGQHQQVADAGLAVETSRPSSHSSRKPPKFPKSKKNAAILPATGQDGTSKEDAADNPTEIQPNSKLQEADAVEVREPRNRLPLGSVESTHRPLTSLNANEENDVLYIYVPFDDQRQTQSRVIRALMDSQSYGKECSKDFTFHDLIDFMQVPTSSESVEENNFRCVDLSDADFAEMAAHFKNKMRRNSKYLFLVRDPRSAIYSTFDRHAADLVDCNDNKSHRCLYDEEILSGAQASMEKWNTQTRQMIDVCHKLGPETCQLFLVEQVITDLLHTLESLGKFLVMDFEKDTYRMLNKMRQKLEDGHVEATTKKQQFMVEFLEFIQPVISYTWPWAGKLPYNLYDHMPSWAPLMGKLGYGFSPDVPRLPRTIVLADLVKND